MKTLLSAPLLHSYPTENSPNNLLVPLSETKTPSDVAYVIQELLSSDYSERTKIALLADLVSFFRWYEEKNAEVFSFTRCMKRDCVDYKHSLISEQKASATINRRLSHIKIFFNTALEKEIIAKSPMQGVKQLPKVANAPKALSEAELRRFMKEVDIRGNIRDKAIIEFMAYAGLRCGEVVRLQHKNITLGERSGRIHIVYSKGNKSRFVPISLKLRETLREFLLAFPPTSTEEFLFQGQRGTLTESGIAKMVENYGRLSNVVTHPHSFRHTFATNFLKSNPGELVALSQLLGHSSINTTALYTQQNFQDLQEKVDATL